MAPPMLVSVTGWLPAYPTDKVFTVLSAIGTRSQAQGQGAASMLVKWGIERADDLQLPCYVESTPAAHSIYVKHGFEDVDRLKLDVAPFKEGDFFHACMIRPAQK